MNQELKKYKKIAFSKHTPTAFVIGSPFQLLCAWNAIEEFEIEDYKIVLLLVRNSIRNQQVYGMLQSRGMDYEVYYADDFKVTDVVSGKIKGSARRYDRIMTGEILYLPNLAICGLFASASSTVVYMDDGAASIRVLTGHTVSNNKLMAFLKKTHILKNPHKATQDIITKYWSQVGLRDYKFYYTIYSDIKTCRFITFPNKFDKLYPSLIKKEEKAVLIIGAHTIDYSKVTNIPILEYEGILWRKLREVRQKHPQERIIYIPHGRDDHEVISQMCDILNIEFNRIDRAIEYYAMCSPLEFTYIYGFSSTAHYTLKLLTKAHVTCWLIMNRLNISRYTIMEIADYYKKQGVVLDKIVYPNPTLCQYWNYYYEIIAKKNKRK